MLVDVREVAERAERGRNEGWRLGDYRVIPSLGRLCSFNDVDRLLPDPVGVAAAVKLSAGLSDRELNTGSLIVGWGAPKVFDRELPPGVFEGGSEVMQGVANDQAEIVRKLRDALHNDDDGPLVGVVFTPSREGVHTVLRGFWKCGRDRIYMGLRPFELYPSAIERTRGRAVAGRDGRDQLSPGLWPVCLVGVSEAGEATV